MISFAQNFEDVILARVFRGRARGSYVDVGAHVPIIDSVTEHFYRSGWRGINIEPLEAAHSELVATRPDDVNLRCAIAAEDGSNRFFALDGFSTLDLDVAQAHQAEGRSSEEITVETLTLATVLGRAGMTHVDFMKVDVEGAEASVLRSNDWTRFRPSLVLVEAIHPVTRLPSHSEWEEVLREAGYDFVYFDGLNRFYWNSELPAPDAACFLPPNVLDSFTPYAQIAAEARAAEAARVAQYEQQQLTRVEAEASRQAEADAARLAHIDAALRRLARDAGEPAPDEAVSGGWQDVVDGFQAAASVHAAAQAAQVAGLDDALVRLAQDGTGRTPHPALEQGWRAIIEARDAAHEAHVEAVSAAHEAHEAAVAAGLGRIDGALHRLAQGHPAAGRPEAPPCPELASGWEAVADTLARGVASLERLQSELAGTQAALAQQRTLLGLSEERRLALLERTGATDDARDSLVPPPGPSAGILPPALDASHIGDDARLYATRHDLLRALPVEPHGIVAEVGVALGDFSVFLVEVLAPRRFVAFDTFDMHKSPEHWGASVETLFGGLTHEAFFRRRCSGFSGILDVEVGDSNLTLRDYPDEHFDLIYIDAAHTYAEVKQDAINALQKLRQGGILVFNDYTMYDVHLGTVHGVVAALNELIVENDLRVIGFGLQQVMSCDVAVRKS